MLSVYFMGQVRGYDPSMWILCRNVFILLGLPVLFGGLQKWGFKGDYALLVIVAFLFSVGQVMQYRIKSDLDSGGRKKRDQQLQTILGNSLDLPVVETMTPEVTPEKKTTTADKDFIKKLIDIVPNWWRVFLYSFGGMYFLYWIVKKYGGGGIDVLERRYFLWLFATIFLLAFFFGISKVGSRGRFLYDMTPWEFFKVTLIVIMAGFLSFPNVVDNLRQLYVGPKGIRLPESPLITFGPLLIILVVPQLMFLLLGDFGQIILFGGLTVIMLFAATRRWMYLVGGALATVVATKLLLAFGGHLLPGRRFARFVIWDNVWNYDAFSDHQAWWDAAFQMANSLFAIDGGGFLGTGPGMGYPTNIPLVVSDFIYAGIAEELGFAGALGVVLLYAMLLLAGLNIAKNCRNEFGRLMAVGFSTMLAIQAFVNIGGVTNLIPMTGLTLPFISRGGFSLIVCFIMIGSLLALSHLTNAEKNLEVGGSG